MGLKSAKCYKCQVQGIFLSKKKEIYSYFRTIIFYYDQSLTLQLLLHLTVDLLVFTCLMFAFPT